eukprot:gb/GECG01003782.1/.p1 GENE.gb/GECG01003782.1/~~gb/GECG01003782.1/.p1  ORF type:complete len:123 (+),score=11.67 gb/GECG01003782.1/:1-369(+)
MCTVEVTWKPSPASRALRAKITQIPLVFADCLTTFKLQGVTADNGLIVHQLGGEKQCPLAATYTALSHVPSLDSIFLLNPLDERKALRWRMSAAAVAEYKSLKKKSKRCMLAYQQLLEFGIS